MSEVSTKAVTAASQASEAVSELLRFAREGNGLPHHPFGSQEPTVELAQALYACIEIELTGAEALQGSDPQEWRATEIDTFGEMMAACNRFVSDLTGGQIL